MNQDDFKKLLEDSLKPLQTGLDEVKKDLNGVKRELNEVKQDLNEVKDTQENQVLPSVITIETTVKSYADAYKINKVNIEKLDDRVTKLEDNASIIPPPEFAIQR